MPGFSVVIPEVEYERTHKNWVKELETGTRSKVVEKGDELSIFGAKIKDVSENPVNVYSTITDMDGGVTLLVAIELEQDRYAGETERSSARNFLFEFAKKEYIALVQDQLNTEKKILRDLEGELASLERGQERMEKSTRSNSEVVAGERVRLNQLSNELANSDTSVGGMGANDPDSAKEAEKERKKTSREIKSSEKKLSQAEKEISENDRKLPDNATEQNAARLRVSQQEAVVMRFEDKLDAIKQFKF
jgi:chromosome segregation ATPase